VSDETFLLGITVEARNRAQPTSDGCSSPTSGLEVPSKALDVDPVYLEQATLMVRAPHCELPQIQGIRLPCRTSIARQEPSERQPFAIGEAPIDTNRATEVFEFIGDLPVRGQKPPTLEQRCPSRSPERTTVRTSR